MTDSTQCAQFSSSILLENGPSRDYKAIKALNVGTLYMGQVHAAIILLCQPLQQLLPIHPPPHNHTGLPGVKLDTTQLYCASGATW